MGGGNMKNRVGNSGIQIGTCLKIGYYPYRLLRETPGGLHLQSIEHDDFGSTFFFHWKDASGLAFMKRNEIEKVIYKHLLEIAFENECDYSSSDREEFFVRFVLSVDDAVECVEIAGPIVIVKLLMECEKFNGVWPGTWTRHCSPRDYMGGHNVWVPDKDRYRDTTLPEHVLPILQLIQNEHVLTMIADEAKHPVVREAAAQILAKRNAP